jgi:hypothetical protein
MTTNEKNIFYCNFINVVLDFWDFFNILIIKSIKNIPICEKYNFFLNAENVLFLKFLLAEFKS